MTRDEVKPGLLVRVVSDRWDAPAGTLARVDSVGHAGMPQDWCFTVEWLNRPAHYGQNRYSLNLFEENLHDFDIHTGPIVQPPDRNPKRRRAMMMSKLTVNSSAYPMDETTLFPTDPPTGPSISDLVRLGTSTWTYEGWKGQVYHKTYPKSRFKQDSLAEYADYRYKGERLFRTVGIDHTFYGPPTAKMLAHYAAQLPVGFQACAKVWEEITVPIFPSGLRYAKKVGPNRRFLDSGYFIDLVLAPFEEAFGEHTGPFILEFQRSGVEAETFLPKLDHFLAHIPKQYDYAIEVRNPHILGPDYRAILAAHGVAHVYNHYTALPSLTEQHEKLEKTFTAPFTVLRLLTPRDTKYHDAVKAYAPYDKIVKPLPEMRRETVDLVRKAIAENRRSYVLVNNRSEGNAPMTVQALVDRMHAVPRAF